MKSSIKSFFLRITRFIGAICVIYISMVFYLALTERQIAFPRAITHKEANEAIRDKAKSISCSLEDGIVLGGWQYGSNDTNVMIYFPDADEDAAQFLAEIIPIENVTLVSFNYRGSANNKGTPSEAFFKSDASHITDCATQVYGKKPTFFTGRGDGSILAAEQFLATTKKQQITQASLILIDPTLSIADRINEKYRLLYPKFIIRADVQMPAINDASIQRNTFIIKDKVKNAYSTEQVIQVLPDANIIQAEGQPLRTRLKQIIQRFTDKEI